MAAATIAGAVPADWWQRRGEIVELLDWLIDRGDITTALEARDVVEKPSKWTFEYGAMVAERDAALAADRDGEHQAKVARLQDRIAAQLAGRVA